MTESIPVRQDRGHRIADCLVIRTDPGAEAANPYYLHRVRPLCDEVAARLGRIADPAVRRLAELLRRDTADVSAYRALVDALNRSTAAGEADEVARTAARRSRIGYRVGDDYRPHREIGPAELLIESTDRGGADADVLVVIPFRDATATRSRFRNLLACLRTLQHQSLPRSRYRICVVESDERERWRDEISALTDDYLFAAKAGPFNKSWTVNVGVVNAGGAAELVCVLDADALVDHHFLERNARRFDRPGTGAFLPFRDLTYLDAHATNQAVQARCLDGAADVDHRRIRAFLVHRSPGVCVWLHREVFDAVDGMDERFEGWGGEDIAFVTRLQLAAPFLVFDDVMYHAHHEPSSHLVGGETVNAHIPRFDWKPQVPIGDPGRFRTS